MSLPAIIDLIPHAKPMALLDHVVSVDSETLCASVHIHAQSLFATPEGVPAWVGIEYMAQAIAAYAGYHARQRDEAVKIGFLLGTRRMTCHVPVFAIGSDLRITVHLLLQAENGLGSFECMIKDQDNTILSEATITVFQPQDAQQFLEESMK